MYRRSSVTNCNPPRLFVSFAIFVAASVLLLRCSQFDIVHTYLQTAIAFEYNNDFGKYLDARMKHFNGNGLAGEAVTAVQGKLDAVKGVMVQNIEVGA